MEFQIKINDLQYHTRRLEKNSSCVGVFAQRVVRWGTLVGVRPTGGWLQGDNCMGLQPETVLCSTGKHLWLWPFVARQDFNQWEPPRSACCLPMLAIQASRLCTCVSQRKLRGRMAGTSVPSESGGLIFAFFERVTVSCWQGLHTTHVVQTGHYSYPFQLFRPFMGILCARLWV